MRSKKTMVIKIDGDQNDPKIESLRRQIVSNLKYDYNIVFLPEDIALSSIDFTVLDEDPCCDDLPIVTKDWDGTKL